MELTCLVAFVPDVANFFAEGSHLMLLCHVNLRSQSCINSHLHAKAKQKRGSERKYLCFNSCTYTLAAATAVISFMLVDQTSTKRTTRVDLLGSKIVSFICCCFFYVFVYFSILNEHHTHK